LKEVLGDLVDACAKVDAAGEALVLVDGRKPTSQKKRASFGCQVRRSTAGEALGNLVGA